MKNNIQEKIDNYYYDLLDDYILFSKNIDNDLELLSNILLDIKYLEYLDSHISKIIEESIYPLKIKQNLDKLISHIDKLIKKSDLENIDEIKKIYYRIYGRKELNNFESSYDIYNLEFTKKINCLQIYLDSNTQIIPVETLENSIQFDFMVMNSYRLDNNSYLSNLSNLVDNKYYIWTINKFLYDTPEIFFNETIKKRTLSVLNYNIASCEDLSDELNRLEYQQFIDENKKLIDRIQNLNKYNMNNSFDVVDLKDYYNGLLMKKIMNKNENIETAEYNDYVKSKYFIEYIEYFIDECNYLISDTGKNRIYYLLYYINEELNNNETKIKVNILKDKLSKINCTNDSNLCYDEATYKYSIKEIISTHIENYFYGAEGLVMKIKNSIPYDFEIIKAYLCDDDKFEELLNSRLFCDERFIFSLRMFLKEYPAIFSSPEIFERTMIIIDNNIKLCNDIIIQKNSISDNKEMISQNKKLIKEIKKISG